MTSTALGSSPLARGTRIVSTARETEAGLIPARAGNTYAVKICLQYSGAHPRSRGEHLLRALGIIAVLGSSPLARGTQSRHLLPAALLGLIPARAGNTLLSVRSNIVVWAHPRSRGEHNKNAAVQRIQQGSSPLARGTRDADQLCQGALGLIPARAGNTSLPGKMPAVPGAHPRSRGEHSASAGQVPLWVGSSPLARGTHLLTWDFTPYISKIESLWSQSLTPEYTISSHY